MNTLRLAVTSDTHGGIAVAKMSECHLPKLATALRVAGRDYPTLNLDNGDTFYGGPLADHVAGISPEENPIGECFHHMRYAAINVGNEDLACGLMWYRRLVETHSLPILSSNLLANKKSVFPSHRIVSVSVGALGQVRVGVLGIVPNCVSRNGNEVGVRGLTQTVASETSQLRASGCDLVVVLAHTGLKGGIGFPTDEACALKIASLPGVDAVIAGHLHECQVTTSLTGTPIIAPGSYARNLGLIDLRLTTKQGRIVVSQHRMALVDVRHETPDKQTLQVLEPHLRSLEQRTGRVIGELAKALSSDFTPFYKPSFIEWAERGIHAFAKSFISSDEIIVATACAGGRGDISWKTVPRGPLTEADLIEFYPYVNSMLLVTVSGKTLTQWVEESTRLFQVVNRQRPDWQSILDSNVPLFDHDFFSGLDYEIDLAQVVGTRIRGLSFLGDPVVHNRNYHVAINSYRYSRLSAVAPGAKMIRNLAPCFRTVLSTWATRSNLPEVYTGNRRFSPLGPAVRLRFRAAQPACVSIPSRFKPLTQEAGGVSYAFLGAE